jgi:hypothetical protein
MLEERAREHGGQIGAERCGAGPQRKISRGMIQQAHRQLILSTTFRFLSAIYRTDCVPFELVDSAALL